MSFQTGTPKHAEGICRFRKRRDRERGRSDGNGSLLRHAERKPVIFFVLRLEGGCPASMGLPFDAKAKKKRLGGKGERGCLQQFQKTQHSQNSSPLMS